MNAYIDENARRMISTTLDSLKKDGTIVMDGGMRRVKVDDKLLQHPSFLASVEKLLKENLQLGSLYSTRPGYEAINPTIGYDEKSGFYVNCNYGYVAGVPDRCFGNIQVNDNGYLTMNMTHVMEYEKGIVNGDKRDFHAGLYVKKEVFDEIGLERADYSYNDGVDYQRRLNDCEPRNHWGKISFSDINGFYAQFPGKENKSIACQRIDDKQLFLPTFQAMTLNSDGTVANKSVSLCPINTEYVERLSHYNLPVAIQDPHTGAYKGYSDHLYDGMQQTDVITSYNDRYAAQLLETTKTKYESPELYEAFVKKFQGTSHTR